MINVKHLKAISQVNTRTAVANKFNRRHENKLKKQGPHELYEKNVKPERKSWTAKEPQSIIKYKQRDRMAW